MALVAVGGCDLDNDVLCPPWGMNEDCEEYEGTAGEQTIKIERQQICDLIGAEVGQPLEAYYGSVDEWVFLTNPRVMRWGAAVIGGGWEWWTSPTNKGDHAVLRAYEGTVAIDDWRSRHDGYVWLLVEEATNASFTPEGVLPETMTSSVEIYDGVKVHYAPEAYGPNYWRVHGQQAKVHGLAGVTFGVDAGPSSSNIKRATADGYRFSIPERHCQPAGGVVADSSGGML